MSLNREDKQPDCKNCGEPRLRHYGRSECCLYDRRGKYDYRTQGKAWPDKQTWYEPLQETV
jgi:molybdenum cofactor biosynthesis enzyme MoaA